MLVYGDHRDLVDPAKRLLAIGEQAAHAAAIPRGIHRHAALVSALIDAGQLLQGIADTDFAQARHDRRPDATDRLSRFVLDLARAVRHSWDSGFDDFGALPRAPSLDDVPQVELRMPEGFAFYALYPEAYLEAARALNLVAEPRVIGIRSIGTTLGAMVAAAFGARGFVTLRPHGDPFARRISVAPDLERELLDGDAHYVIVDEGPGLSGSSFGAVADWLQARGVPLERIAFVPSHAGAPGPRASGAHCQRWAQAQRAAGDFGDRLPRLLSSWAGSLIGPLDEPLTDISGGKWRQHVCADEQQWPAANPAWERRKFLARVRGERFLIKFAGLGSIGERKLEMARALHSAGLAPEPLTLVHGFLVERWCAGARPLLAGEKPIHELARYIGARGRLLPAPAGSGAAVGELLEMCRRNVQLALGERHAAGIARWDSHVEALSRRVARARTDNRLVPHEFVRTSDRRLLKTDALDHHCGHDLIGCQDIAWDVAGALVEFNLHPREAAELINATEEAAGRRVDRELLEFFRLAYVAFRVGQTAMSIEMCDDPRERQRLGVDARYYRELLRHALPASRDARGLRGLLGRMDGGTNRLGNKLSRQSVEEEEAGLSR